MRKILITGGAGFIGSKIAKNYADKGHQVLIYDSFLEQVHGAKSKVEQLKFQLNQFAQVESGDINDFSRLQATVKRFKPEICFHMAAETGTGQSKFESYRYISTNIQGTANLIAALNSIDCFERFILPSSRAIYGEGAYIKNSELTYGWKRKYEDMKKGKFGVYCNDIELTATPTPESALPSPCSLYASTKLMQELTLEQSARNLNWSSVVLRFQNVYGPGQSLINPYTGVLSIFSEQIKKGKSLNIYEDGLISRDFVYIDDVVNACMSAERSNVKDGSVFNIGTGKAAYIKDVAEELLALLGSSRDQYYISGDFRDGDIRHASADITRAASELNWIPQTDISKGLKEFTVWTNRI